MATAPQGTNATPERIFATLIAFQLTEALKAAIELDIFTKIAEGANDADSAGESGGRPDAGRASWRLHDHRRIPDQGRRTIFAGAGFGAVPEQAVARVYGGEWQIFWSRDPSSRFSSCLAESVRKGGCATNLADNAEPHDDFWVTFARSMAGLATPSAEYIAAVTGAAEGKPVKVLDIAAGHGMFGITIARRNPTAQVVALDWPAVLAVAQENAKKFGVADRVTSKPGSAFETDFGDGYDYVLLTNILHHFDRGGLRNPAATCAPGVEARRKGDHVGVRAQ